MLPKIRYGGLIFVIIFRPGWAHFILQKTDTHQEFGEYPLTPRIAAEMGFKKH